MLKLYLRTCVCLCVLMAGFNPSLAEGITDFTISYECSIDKKSQTASLDYIKFVSINEEGIEEWVSPEFIDWNNVGKIDFIFPNSYSVDGQSYPITTVGSGLFTTFGGFDYGYVGSIIIPNTVTKIHMGSGSTEQWPICDFIEIPSSVALFICPDYHNVINCKTLKFDAKDCKAEYGHSMFQTLNLIGTEKVIVGENVENIDHLIVRTDSEGTIYWNARDCKRALYSGTYGKVVFGEDVQSLPAYFF